MSTDAKEKIRDRLDLAEVVGEAVSLKPAGKGRLKGLCPFHSEKTPSFHVLPDRGFYYCFGCQAKGDVFDFVMQTQGLGFYDVLVQLGHRAGVEVAPQAPQASKRRDLFEINELAVDFFRKHLDGPARSYLEGRKLTADSVERFGLGYAPDSWDSLLRHALAKGADEDALLAAGLLSENASGRRYDRFRNRVMFPIRDYLGRVVGFAGRVLDDSLPKYLNTPETELFHKGELLYGLDLAKTAIRDEHTCIVVEGYMDVIALHQVGIANAVAALGATMTADQAQILSRLDVQRVYLAFDADAAGQRAVVAGLDQSIGRRFLVRAVEVPAGKDPADAVLDGDVAEFRAALERGLAEVEFRFQNVLERFDADTTEGKKAILEELLPRLKPRDVFDPVAVEMRRLVIDHLGIDGARLDAWVNSKERRGLDETHVRGLERSRPKRSQMAVIELEVIALLLLEPTRLRERLDTVVAALPPGLEDSVLHEFHGICEGCRYDDQEVLMRYRERDEGSVLFERLFSQHEDDARVDVAGHIEKSLSRLRELYLDGEKEAHRRRLLDRMEEVTRSLTDPELSAEDLKRYYEELKEIQAMLAARDAERRLRVPTAFGRAAKKRGGY